MAFAIPIEDALNNIEDLEKDNKREEDVSNDKEQEEIEDFEDYLIKYILNFVENLPKKIIGVR